MKALSASAIIGVLLAMGTPAAGQTPLGTAFTYQGKLADAGSPANGPYDMHFRLYDAASGGTQLGPVICYNNLNVAEGLFTATLDFGAQFPGEERYLEIAIRADTGLNCANTTGFTTLSPRQRLTAAPNATFALSADKLDGFDSTAFLQSVPNPLTLSGNSATHLLRAENSSSAVGASGVYGLATDAASPNYGGRFESNSTMGRGVFGQAGAASGNTVGGYFESNSTSGIGVFASASAASGAAYGLSARSNSTSGRGVYGWANAGSGTTYGGYFQSASTDGRGVFGLADATSGITHGGSFQSVSTSGIGCFGLASATGGTNYGVWGQSDSASGIGVFGEQTATSGTTYAVFGRNRSSSGVGVLGTALSNTGPTTGVFGRTVSPDGTGVFGQAVSGTGLGVGVAGYTNAASGTGVHGHAGHPSGAAIGVHGESSSPAGTGVKGEASAATGTTYGVYGESISATGYAGFFVGSGADALYVENGANGRGVHIVASADTAVWALTTSGVAGVDGRNASSTGRGLYGYATATTGTNFGVYGRTASGSGYGVYSLGNTGASGTKSFQIDHPDDPENKYLLHYSAESPEVINFYRGTVVLNEHGEAVVELPQYFARINKTPSYQLTAVGAPMPNLHVAEKISDEALGAGATAGPGDAVPICSFRIAGGVPGGEVSWRVETVRNDLRMRLHGAPVEREKVGPERGKYLHPEYYGQPPEMGIDFQAEGHARCDESRRNEHGTREAGER